MRYGVTLWYPSGIGFTLSVMAGSLSLKQENTAPTLGPKSAIEGGMGQWLLRWSCGCGRTGLLLQRSVAEPGEQLTFMCPVCLSPVFSATFPGDTVGRPEVTVVRWDAAVEAIDMERIGVGGIDLGPKPPRGRGPAPAG